MKLANFLILINVPTFLGFNLKPRDADAGSGSADPFLSRIKNEMAAITAEAAKDTVVRKRSKNLLRGFISEGLVPNDSESKRYLRLAGASYCSNKALEAWSCGHCKQSTSAKYFTVIEDPTYSTKALIAVDSTKNEIIISFRGSSNLPNWFQNAKLIKTDLLSNNPDIKVHLGFKQCRDKLSELYIPILTKLLSKNPGFTIVSTGHSLGGAIATLAILDINNKLKVPFKDMRLVTFCQPRVGNANFAEWFNKSVLDSARFTNNNDPVPRLPSRVLGFVHQHTEVYIKGMVAKTCSNKVLEDDTCLSSDLPGIKSALVDHTTVWGIQFGGGCD
ncbi:alpha/beta-hydrolase [Neoconidiobolus thromboides FSU 785]|nr:alpha/beta-hydrolase [Neoconidiobolus thromboides FSU 785]